MILLPAPLSWRAAHPSVSSLQPTPVIEMGSFCPTRKSVAPGRMALHHVARRCTALHRVAPRCTSCRAKTAKPCIVVHSRAEPGRLRRVTSRRRYSIVKEPGRRSAVIAPHSAPSHTGHLCAIVSASAQSNAAGASKAWKKFSDFPNSFCALREPPVAPLVRLATVMMGEML